MSDDMIKIMSSLGLNYQPAIDSTKAFSESIDNLNKQLEKLKSVAMDSANGVNNAFSSQLKEMNRFYGNMANQNKPIEIKVVTDKAERVMEEFTRSMGLKLDKNLREQFKGLADSMISDGEAFQKRYENLLDGVNNAYVKAMQRDNKKLVMSEFANSDDMKIYDELRGLVLHTKDLDFVSAKNNVEGFTNALKGLANLTDTGGHGRGLDVFQETLRSLGVSLSSVDNGLESFEERIVRAVTNVRMFKQGFENLSQSATGGNYQPIGSYLGVDLDEVKQFVGDELIKLASQLGTVRDEAQKAHEEVAKVVSTPASVGESGASSEIGRKLEELIHLRNTLQLDAQSFVERASVFRVDSSKWNELSKAEQLRLTRELVKAENEHQRVLAESANTESSITNQVKETELAKLKAQAADIQQKVSARGLSEEYFTQASSLREQLAVIMSRLQVEGKLTSEEIVQTQQIKEQLDLLRSQTGEATSDSRRNPVVSESVDNRMSYYLTHRIYRAISSAAREMKETIKDVEFGMVEIARVMNDSSFVFEDYRNNLLQLGVDYGQSFNEVQSIALRWAQSGYNVADSLELAKTSLLALNTAELDAKNATESMIGIMSQWQLEAKDLALVMDKINITADNYSVTSQDLVDGLLRSSSAARNMNMSIDETIGLLTVMREASGRTGSEVGNALNSILSYIQRPKSIEALEGMGIQMFTDSTKAHFRNALDIFKDIASSWGSLSTEIQDGFVQSADDAGLFNEELATAIGMQEQWNDVQRRDVSQASAGVYRRNYFISMIERMSNVQGVLNNMMDAGGYSIRENSRTMESLEKKTASLKASTEALAVAVGDAGLTSALKLLADVGTNVFESITNLPKPMRDLLLASTSVFAGVSALRIGLKMFGIQIPGLMTMVDGLRLKVIELQYAFQGGAAGMLAFAKANPLLILSASVGIIMTLVNAWKRHREEQEKAIAVSKQKVESYQEESKGLESLSKEYDTLKSKEKNLTATFEEKDRLKEVQRELVDLYGVSISGIDAEGKAYADSLVNIRNRINDLKELEEVELRRQKLALNDKRKRNIKEIDSSNDDIDVLKKKIAETDKLMKELESAYMKGENINTSGGRVAFGKKGYDESYEKQLNDYKKYAEKLKIDMEKVIVNLDISTDDVADYLTRFGLTAESELGNAGKRLSDSARLAIKKLSDGLSMDNVKSLDELASFVGDFVNGFAEFDKAYQKAVSDMDNEAIDKASVAISEFVSSIADGNPTLNAFVIAMARMYPNAKDLASLNDFSNAANGQSVSIIELYESVSKAIDEFDLFGQALKELNDEGQFSRSTYEKLIEVNSDFIGILGLEKKAAIDLLTVNKAKRKQIIDDMIAEQEAVIKSTLEKIKAYGGEMEAIEALANAKRLLMLLESGQVSSDDSVADRKAILERRAHVNSLQGYIDAIGEAKNKIEALKGMKSLFDSVDKKNTDKDKSKKDEYKAEADRYAKINFLIEKSNALLSKNKTLQELAGDDIAKKIKLQEELIALEEVHQYLLHQKANMYRDERVELEKSLTKQGFVFSGDGDNRTIVNLDRVKGKTKEVEEQFKRYLDIQSKEIPSLQQSWWNFKKSIDDTKESIIQLGFALNDQAVNNLKKSLSDLEYQFKLLDDNDFNDKAMNIFNQMKNMEGQVKILSDELDVLNGKGFKEGSVEATLYKYRIETLTKQIQDGTLAIKDFEKAISDLKESQIQNWIRKQNDAYKDQQDRLGALSDIQEKIVQIIRKRGEEEKKALDEAHKKEMDSLEERHNERKKRYQEELDEFRKMIQDKINALDEQYEEEDYLESLNKERDEANRLQKDIDVLSLDNSLSARNKVIELRKKLAEQNEKIAKMQQKRERDLLKKSLQEQLKDKEKDSKDREDISNNLYESEKKRLEEEYQINKELLDRKYSDEKVYAEAKESIMRGQVEVARGVFMDIYDAFSDFEDKFGKGMGVLGDIIRDDFIKQLEMAQNAIKEMDYLSSNRLPQYDNNYRPSDDDIGWKEPDRPIEDVYGNDRKDMAYENHHLYKAFSWYKDYSEKQLQDEFKFAEQQYDYATTQSQKESWLDMAEAANRFANLMRSGEFIVTAADFFRSRGRNVVKGYDLGGKVDYTGLAMVHGENSPEWMLRDFHLKKIISDSVLSTVKIAMPKIPSMNNIGKSVTLKVDKLINIEGNMSESLIPQVKVAGNDVLKQLERELKKFI